MADVRQLQSFNRPLALRLGGVLLTVCALLWGAWVSREVARPREQIVTVRLAETIARFVDAEARAARDPEVGQARTLAYLKAARSEEHTSELQSLMRISYAVFSLIKKRIQVQCRSKTP